VEKREKAKAETLFNGEKSGGE